MEKDFLPIKEAAEEERKRQELDFDSRLVRQEKLSWQIVVGVVVAFLFTLGLVGLEVMLFHTRNDKDFYEMQNRYYQELTQLREKNSAAELRIEQKIESLREDMQPKSLNNNSKR